MEHVMRYLDLVFRHLNKLGTWEWFFVLIAVLGLGIVCMKGFDTRTGC